ncbi:hypothetical protein C8R46DRAFT_1077794 [Mycena filopes]|nr:hypothetical protein C8R46DRAFT_1077794 [Mycena filopes]
MFAHPHPSASRTPQPALAPAGPARASPAAPSHRAPHHRLSTRAAAAAARIPSPHHNAHTRADAPSRFAVDAPPPPPRQFNRARWGTHLLPHRTHPSRQRARLSRLCIARREDVDAVHTRRRSREGRGCGRPASTFWTRGRKTTPTFVLVVVMDADAWCRTGLGGEWVDDAVPMCLRRGRRTMCCSFRRGDGRCGQGWRVTQPRRAPTLSAILDKGTKEDGADILVVVGPKDANVSWTRMETSVRSPTRTAMARRIGRGTTLSLCRPTLEEQTDIRLQ